MVRNGRRPKFELENGAGRSTQTILTGMIFTPYSTMNHDSLIHSIDEELASLTIVICAIKL